MESIEKMVMPMGFGKITKIHQDVPSNICVPLHVALAARRSLDTPSALPTEPVNSSTVLPLNSVSVIPDHSRDCISVATTAPGDENILEAESSGLEFVLPEGYSSGSDFGSPHNSPRLEITHSKCDPEDIAKEFIERLQMSVRKRKAREERWEELHREGKIKLPKEEWLDVRERLECKLSRFFDSMLVITRGWSLLKEQKIEGRTPHGKILRENFFLEAVTPSHPIGAAMDEAIAEWKEADGLEGVSFLDWLGTSAYQRRVADGWHVMYVPDERQHDFMLDTTTQRGIFLRAGKPFSTRKMRAAHATSRRSVGAWVIGPDLAFYAGEFVNGRFHHTSYLAGGAVVCAGEFTVDDNGKLLYISNRSGHYLPGHEHILDALRLLRERGFDLTDVALDIYEPSTDVVARYASALAYLNAHDPRSMYRSM